MFPIMLDVKALKLLLVGNGKATLRRLELLDEAGAAHVKLFADNPIAELAERAGTRLTKSLPTEKDFIGIQLVMIADFDNAQTAKLADIARAKGILVNAEDKMKWCDYHVPAIVRRGDLLLTISTGGGSPRLARRLRIWLSDVFAEDWGARLEHITAKRNEWKKQGVGFTQMAEKTDAIIEEKGWFPPCKNTRAMACGVASKLEHVA